MKRTMLALIAAIIILSGCQDEKPAGTSAADTPPTKEIPVIEEPDVIVAPEEQAVEEQGISTETFVDNELDENEEPEWVGTYQGTLPCADCPEIDITITLHQDGTYELKQNYQGEEDGQRTSEGQFSWNESEDTITLINEEEPNQYFVGEDVLMKLDMNGEIVTGELSAHYNLFKLE